jgi:hypothetical protein
MIRFAPSGTVHRQVFASSTYLPVGSALPGAGSSVTPISRASSREMGTVMVAQVCPPASTLKVPPLIGGAPGRTNQSW